MSKVYEMVTERIIAQLEKGTAPWRKTWSGSFGEPRSMSTGNNYKGINRILLSGYDSPFWGTYKAVKDNGGQVRKGEKSSIATFWKFIEKKGSDEKFPLLRYYRVFNADQCDWPDGLPD